MYRTCIFFLTWMIMNNAAHANDRYYMVLFGSQDGANRPKMAHSFAAFVKLPDSNDADSEDATPAEVHAISWLPASGRVVLLRLGTEQGKNFSLQESIQYAQSLGTSVTAWGPFEVKKELYDMAMKQIARLNGGQLGYIALDKLARGNGGTNCIHAISDLDTTQPALDTGMARGNAATQMILQHLRRWIVDPNVVESSLIEKMNLKDAGITWVGVK